MPTNLAETLEYPTAIQAPLDGEAGVVASVNLAFSRLANRTFFIASKVPGVFAGYKLHLPLFQARDEGGEFIEAAPPGGDGLVLQQNGTDATKALRWTVVAPPGTRIVAVTAEVHGGSTHVGLPATKPAVSIKGFSWDAATLSYSESDGSASVAAYEDVHEITKVVALDTTADFGGIYIVSVTGEGGANALANQFHVGRVWLTLDPTP